MRYLALACDYDGTLATDGHIDQSTIVALERVRDSGRRLILVTGRQLDDLQRVCPRLDLFDRVVAENGALLFRPSDRETKALADPPPDVLIRALRDRRVEPLSVGRVIVATWTPHETTVLDVIRDLGLEHQVIFNKRAVMVLPSGVNKASGLRTALDELALSPHIVVGIGDAENDHAFLSLCECAVAVENALPMLKGHADLVTTGSRGAGVVELADMLVRDDLHGFAARLTHHDVPLGTCDDDGELAIHPYGTSLLLAGSSGSGKSTWATGLLERLAEQGYQFFIVDPEGDYESFEAVAVLGDGRLVPSVDEILDLLERPEQQVAADALSPIDAILAIGEAPERTIQDFSRAVGRPVPDVPPVDLETGQALVWMRRTETSVTRLHVLSVRSERRRHLRKYVEGDLGPNSFHFRGPDGRLNLRAQNLSLFNQLADGVDDATWLHHLRQRDYSRWFREAIKDDSLAAEAARIEDQDDLPPRRSRELIRAVIEERYTAPA